MATADGVASTSNAGGCNLDLHRSWRSRSARCQQRRSGDIPRRRHRCRRPALRPQTCPRNDTTTDPTPLSSGPDGPLGRGDRTESRLRSTEQPVPAGYLGKSPHRISAPHLSSTCPPPDRGFCRITLAYCVSNTGNSRQDEWNSISLQANYHWRFRRTKDMTQERTDRLVG